MKREDSISSSHLVLCKLERKDASLYPSASTCLVHILIWFCEMTYFLTNKLSSFLHSSSSTTTYYLLIQMKSVLAVALVASASAFVPAQNARMPTKLNFEYGEYDDKLWDQDSKKDVYNKWDPSQPRTTRNFNPFETFKGNSPDASGIYPGEVSDWCA